MQTLHDYPCQACTSEPYQTSCSLTTEQRNDIIEQYLPLVRKIAGFIYRNHARQIDYEDLVNVGVLGLIQTVKNYDPEYNVNFAGYCKARIRGAMLDELRRLDWVSRQKRKQLREIETATHQFHLEFNRKPDSADLAETYDIPEKTLNACKNRSEPVKMLSLNELVCYDLPDSEFTDLLADDNTKSPQQEMEENDSLNELTRGLSKIEQLVMILYYREGLNMHHTGLLLGISESRVCQIHRSALLQLKAKFQSPAC